MGGRGGDDQVVWDLSESLAELYERDQRREAVAGARGTAADPAAAAAAGENTSPKVSCMYRMGQKAGP